MYVHIQALSESNRLLTLCLPGHPCDAQSATAPFVKVLPAAFKISRSLPLIRTVFIAHSFGFGAFPVHLNPFGSFTLLQR
jgi:hypothetical protein